MTNDSSSSELSKLIGDLDQRCKAAGPDTPTGSRLSMLSQQLQNYEKADDPKQRLVLSAFMARVSTELAQIDADGGEYIPEHHIPRSKQ